MLLLLLLLLLLLNTQLGRKMNLTLAGILSIGRYLVLINGSLLKASYVD